jgi:hypothetical protein
MCITNIGYMYPSSFFLSGIAPGCLKGPRLTAAQIAKHRWFSHDEGSAGLRVRSNGLLRKTQESMKKLRAKRRRKVNGEGGGGGGGREREVGRPGRREWGERVWEGLRERRERG